MAASLPRATGGRLSHTILIADDNALFRKLLRSCIEQNSDWQVCGEAQDGKVAVEKVKELHPDLVILDLSMPEINGLEAARQITHIAPDTVMVMITMYGCEQLLKEAHAAGIKDVLSKSDGVADQLLALLRNVRP